ncbi:hypothetical protein HJC99_02660 [Candidatus Saccharibacteria bacterium]|nr:hypothetical protein [Candidatus Saccharibacteria bacterium]
MDDEVGAEYSVDYSGVPRWLVVCERLITIIDVGHWWCMPAEWLFRIPVGRRHYETEGGDRYLVCSVGSCLHESFYAVFGLEERYIRIVPAG